MIRIPFPSFITRPLPYLVLAVLTVLWLCFWPFNFLQTNRINWEPDGGLRFLPPATAYTPVAPAKLVGLPQFTILVDAKALPPWRHARIFSYSLHESRFNMNLEQFWEYLILRVRSGTRSHVIMTRKIIEPTRERRLAIAVVYTGSEIALYVDGKPEGRVKCRPLDYSTWSTSYPLVLGSQAGGQYTWRGIYYMMAVLKRACPTDQLRNPDQLLQDSALVLHYAFNEGRGTTVLDRAPGVPAHVSWPERFAPFARTVFLPPEDYWPQLGRPFFRDIFANIAIYVPIGYLLALWLAGSRIPRLLLILLPILGGLLLSTTIEYMQAFLPTRNSSTVDVLMNSIGSALGVLLWWSGWVPVVLRAAGVRFRNDPHEAQSPPRLWQ